MIRMNARLLGFLYADGWASHNKTGEYYEVCFQQSLENHEKYMYYRKLLLEEYKGYYRERTRRNKLELCIYSKNYHDLIKDLKSNPIKYLEENPQEFIKGLLDGDGSVMKNEIALYNKNKELLIEICRFLKSLGIKCIVKPCKNIWRIRIRQKSSIKLFLSQFSNY